MDTKKRKQEIKNSGSNGSMHPRLTCSGHFWWGHCSAARHECWPMCGNWLDYPMMNESAPCGRHGILMPLTVKVSWKSSKWVEVVVLEKRRQFNHDLTGLSMGWAKLHLHIHTCVHIHMLCLLYIIVHFHIYIYICWRSLKTTVVLATFQLFRIFVIKQHSLVDSMDE